MNLQKKTPTETSKAGKIKWDDIKDWVDDDLILYIQKCIKVDKVEAMNLLQEVKKYLLVANNNYSPNKNFSPSTPVDEAWHAFILFTPVYSHFCKNVLGRDSNIPHIPSVGKWRKVSENSAPGEAKQPYINALKALKDEIGTVNEKYWPDPESQNNECCTPCKLSERGPIGSSENTSKA